MIFTELGVLVEVTDNMRKLKVCPKCAGNRTLFVRNNCNKHDKRCEDCAYINEGGPCNVLCHTCNGTGLNPDQSAWWDALLNAKEFTNVGDFFYPPKFGEIDESALTIFAEIPESMALSKRMIHRHDNDLRPWPKALHELLAGYIAISVEALKEKELPHFALATQETASIYKSFGIETWLKL